MSVVTTSLFGDLAYLVAQPSKISETLEWKNDLFLSRDGTEQVANLRITPKNIINFIYPIPQSEIRSTFNTVWSAKNSNWVIPFWMRAEYLGTLASSTNPVNCDTTYRDYMDNSLVLIYESPSKYEVKEISSVGVNQLNLVSSVTNSYTKAYIMPARPGVILGNPTIQTNGYNSQISMNLEVTQFNSVTPPSYTQFNSKDFYTDENLLESIEQSIESRVDIIESGVGARSTFFPWINNRITYPYRVVTRTPQELFEFLQWTQRQLGRNNQFYSPSFLNDMQHVSSGSLTTTLLVRMNSFKDFDLEHTHIAIKTKDGTWHARTITSSVDAGGGVLQLTLNSSLGFNASTIRKISFLGLKRLESDRVEINYLSNGVATSQFNILEIEP